MRLFVLIVMVALLGCGDEPIESTNQESGNGGSLPEYEPKCVLEDFEGHDFEAYGDASGHAMRGNNGFFRPQCVRHEVIGYALWDDDFDCDEPDVSIVHYCQRNLDELAGWDELCIWTWAAVVVDGVCEYESVCVGQDLFDEINTEWFDDWDRATDRLCSDEPMFEL